MGGVFDRPKAQMSQDRFTGHAIQMNDDHANVHLGIAYSAWSYGSIANDGYVQLELTTPSASDAFVHLKKIELWAEELPWIFEILEAPTVTTGVTEFTPQNRLRSSDRAAMTTVKTNPTNVSGGTEVEGYMFGGGSGVGSTSSGSNRDTALEIVLKPDTTYVIRAQNTSGGAANASLWIYFYEEN